jgi:hypothetical protein
VQSTIIAKPGSTPQCFRIGLSTSLRMTRRFHGGPGLANRETKNHPGGWFFVDFRMILIFGYVDGDDIAKVTNQLAIDIAMDF